MADARVHYSIVEAIAAGEHAWSGITRRVGQSGGSLSRPLRWLEEMDIVRRITPVTDRSSRRPRRALYRIADPHLAFWHRLISPLVHSGSVGLVPPRTLWTEAVERHLAEHAGAWFEEACRQWAARTDRLPLSPLVVGEWWDTTSQNQVALVAVDRQGDLLQGECNRGALTLADLTTLTHRAHLIASELGGPRRIHLALFTARGLVDDAVRNAVEAGRAPLYTAAD